MMSCPNINYIQLKWFVCYKILNSDFIFSGNGDKSWCFSQIKGALDDDVTDADIISCVEFNHDGELLATGDKGGRVVIFQVSLNLLFKLDSCSIWLNRILNRKNLGGTSDLVMPIISTTCVWSLFII